MAYIAYNGLSALVNGHPFYTHGLLGFNAVFLDGINLGKLGADKELHRLYLIRSDLRVHLVKGVN